MKKIDIVYEDKNIIIVNKEHNLLTISTEKREDNTLYSMVFDYMRKKDKRNRIFIVHRLDRDTGGLIIFAKNEASKYALQENWENVVRKYYAVVHGRISSHGTIKSFLKESKTFVTYSSSDGKEAITEYWQKKQSRAYSLVDIKLHTGRKNQIRVHMSENNTPILGDKKYGLKDHANHMYLYAYYLSFVHPITKEQLTFEQPIPKDYEKLFN